jgi:hypothetical protein
MNYSYPSNITGFGSLNTWVNDVGLGVWGWGLLLAIFIIAFVIFNRIKPIKESFAYAAWMTAVLALLATPIGIVDTWVALVTIIFAALATIWLKKGGE